MTKKELSQLYYLNREIKDLQKRLCELEALATSCTSHITGMPKGGLSSDKIAKYTAEIGDIKEIIDLRIKQCFYELSRLNRFIEGIEDSQMRQILSLRYVNGLTWNQVAISISNCLNGECVRKAHDRFLEKIKSCPLCPPDV